MIEKLSYRSYFPYPDYRDQQERIIRQIEQSARKRSNMLLVAPNGTGKTVIALSALLPVVQKHDLKLIYLCRTHSQSDRVITELKKIHDNPHAVLGLSFAGGMRCVLTRVLGGLEPPPVRRWGSVRRCEKVIAVNGIII